MNPNESQTPAPPNPPPDALDLRIQQIEERAQTFGELVEFLYVELLRPGCPEYPVFQDEQFGRRMPRYCKPWPPWVLRIAAGVLQVRFPKISKQTIFDVLCFLNFLLLEFKRNTEDFSGWPKLPDVDKKVMGAIFGHLLAHFLKRESQGQAECESKQPPAKATAKIPSLDDLEKQLVPMFADYFKQFPEGYLGFQSAFADAKDGTFAKKKGHLKETPLAPIYQKILADWTEIECLSGPKALCDYLSPMLGNQPYDLKYERVKAICKRMRITFKPPVKRQ